jgi:GTP-binding protein
MEALGTRRGDLVNMESDSQAARASITASQRGPDRLPGEFMNLTRGTGLMSHVFDSYAPVKGRNSDAPQRRADFSRGRSTASRTRCGSCRIAAGCSCRRARHCTRAMVIGIHSRDNDLVVNPIKGKQLTNVRPAPTKLCAWCRRSIEPRVCAWEFIATTSWWK